MVRARETRVTQRGSGFSVRLPSELVEFVGLKRNSKVRVELSNGSLQVVPVKAKRRHIPLAERMEKALASGTWDGSPYEITQEDRLWLGM